MTSPHWTPQRLTSFATSMQCPTGHRRQRAEPRSLTAATLTRIRWKNRRDSGSSHCGAPLFLRRAATARLDRAAARLDREETAASEAEQINAASALAQQVA